MKRLVFVYSAAAVLIVGVYAVSLDPVPTSQQAQAQAPIEQPVESIPTPEPKAQVVVLPIAGYEARDTFKNFGEFIDDRFHGYHMGDDVEYGDTEEHVPVVSIADGTVVELKEFVEGYGGFILTRHRIDGKTVTALYGHLDTKQIPLKIGDTVKQGQVIAYLGEADSHETDGRRKHLHFGLYTGDEIRYLGYEKDADKVSTWLNPRDFFVAQGAFDENDTREFKSPLEPGDLYTRLHFTIPVGMEVEYDPDTRELNVFRHAGVGTARDRSQIIVRVSDTDATQYAFEKNPNLDSKTYAAFLESVVIKD